MSETLSPVEFQTPVTVLHSEALQPHIPIAAEQIGKLMVAATFAETSVQPDQLSKDEGTALDKPEISRINKNHGRSFEVGQPALFQDEYGNRFLHLSVKGGGPYKIEKHQAFSADELGFTPKGFASNAAVDRIVGVSQFLRSNGIDTEYPIAVARPETFPIKTEDGIHHMTQQEIYEAIDPDIQIPEGHELVTYLRASKTPIRIDDFAPDKNESPEYVPELLGSLARDLKVTAKNEQEREAVFDPTNPEEVRNYFVSVLPILIGSNLAAIHSARLAHNSFTRGNITAAGGVVDLDSVTGEPLGFGDKKVLPVDMLGDLYLLLGGLSPDFSPLDEHQVVIGTNGSKAQEIIASLYHGGFLGKASDDIIDQVEESRQLVEQFKQNVLIGYKTAGADNSMVQTTLNLYEKGNAAYMQHLQEQSAGQVYG